MRKLILTMAALSLAVPALAQSPTSARADFAVRYDVDSATKTYCVLNGSNGSPFGSATRISAKVETTGSSITITAVTALSAPFTNVSIGDVLYFTVSGATVTRVVVSNADNDTVTVDTAIDLSAGAGFTFSYKEPVCGTAATFGWISVEGYSVAQMNVAYAQGDLDALDVSFECRDRSPDGNIVQVYPGAASACGFGALATNVCRFATPATLPAASLSFKLETNAFADCRVALKYQSTDTSDATTDRELVNASLDLWRY